MTVPLMVTVAWGITGAKVVLILLGLVVVVPELDDGALEHADKATVETARTHNKLSDFFTVGFLTLTTGARVINSRTTRVPQPR